MTGRKSEEIGLIGVGRMGRGLLRNWVLAGYEVYAYDSSDQSVGDIEVLGGKPASSIEEIVRSADIIATCLPTLSVVEQVYFGDPGILKNTPSGRHILDFTSGSPVLTQRIGDAAKHAGLRFNDVPILRGEREAWDGTIRLIAGGDADDLSLVSDVLNAVCEDVRRVGPLGHGHAFKAINNSVTMANHTALCEAFAVAKSKGLDLAALYEILDSSQASSKKLHELGPKLVTSTHKATIAVGAATKDVSNFAALGVETGVPTPVADSVHSLLRIAAALGFGQEATSHLMTTLLMLAGQTTDADEETLT